MIKLVVLGLALVVAVEAMAFTMADHRFVLWVSGGAAALVLLAGRRLLDRESGRRSRSRSPTAQRSPCVAGSCGPKR